MNSGSYSYDSGYITKLWVENDAFKNVLSGGYGVGGGPKVPIIARLNKEDGKIAKATFIYSKLSTGKTNSLTVKYFGTEKSSADAPLVIYGDAASNPITVGKSITRDGSVTDADRVNGAFKVRYEISRQLNYVLASNGKFRGHIETNAGTKGDSNW